MAIYTAHFFIMSPSKISGEKIILTLEVNQGMGKRGGGVVGGLLKYSGDKE